jgi:hypothetical protein
MWVAVVHNIKYQRHSSIDVQPRMPSGDTCRSNALKILIVHTL